MGPLPLDPFPPRPPDGTTSLASLVQTSGELTVDDRDEVALTKDQVACIDHWNKLLQSIPEERPLPSFPIWGDEIFAEYPFSERTPFACTKKELLALLAPADRNRRLTKRQLLSLLPSYARSETRAFPAWKIKFLRQNRQWLQDMRPFFPDGWAPALRDFVPSHRKLEWNCQGETRDLWRCVLQFRPSGLRAKRYTACPALVAMTTTQIPVLGRERRFLTRTEGLRLQGFPDRHHLPKTRAAAFRALGNAVHVGAATAVAMGLLGLGGGYACPSPPNE